MDRVTNKPKATDSPKARLSRRPRTVVRRRADRDGAAAVEFAFVAPFLILFLLLPIFEFGRGFMVAELMANAARSGCRVGVISGNTNAAVTTAVTTALTGQGINGATTTITVNGSSADVSTASSGDTISVTVSVPYANVALVPGAYLTGLNLSGSQIMRHE